MSDDVTDALREIAALLRQRVEQQAEMAQRAQEHMAKYQPPTFELPDLAKAHEREAAAAREAWDRAERQRREDVAFRERLLAVLERQNELLERLVDRAAPS